jgi:(p)ppGpp synthase/HD superfamily hydrolase
MWSSGEAAEKAQRLLADAAPGLLACGQAVVGLLDRWGARADLLCAGLLHEAVAQERMPITEVAAACGADAAFLCETFASAAALPFRPQWRGRAHARRCVQVYTAAYAHPEAALLCVAHMWVAGGLTENTQIPHLHSLALPRAEALQALGSIFDMLGTEELADQLSALQSGGSGETPPEQARLFAALQADLGAVLPNAILSLQPRRQPGPPGLERGWGVEVVPDRQTLYAQVLVPGEADCYLALRHLHRLYHPLDGTLVDTVGAARINGHRSLQTCAVATLAGQNIRLDARICTPQMARVNAWGALAPYLRSAESDEGAAGDAYGAYAGVWWRRAAEGYGQIVSASPGALDREAVYVLSPLGQLFPFQRGSTVVDFAYQVHSDLAEQCRRFIINGEAVEPATILRHLDLVEMERDPRAPGPTLAWLNAAHTKRARSHIRRFLRRQDTGVGDGRQIVDQRLRALEDHYGFHLPDHRVEESLARAARHLGLHSTEELLGEIAAGRAAADQTLHPLFAEEVVRRLDLPRALRVRPHQVALAQCCKPRPGDAIAARPRRRAGVLTKLTVHRGDCPRLALPGAHEGEEPIALRWRLQRSSKIVAQVEVTARDEDGLLGAALAQVYAFLPRVTLLRTDAQARRGTARLRFSVEADARETVDEIADALRRLPGREVGAVRQLTLPPSEQEMLLADGALTSNPYSRMPVHDPSMFFGRTAELERINDWLRNNVACVWLRGQKRVGKTSLLLHLRHHFWEPHETICAFVDFQLFSNLAQANLFYEIASAVYADLAADPRVAALGAPDRTRFEQDAPAQFVAYLRDLRRVLGTGRLVLLMDEFSRITDLYLDGRMGPDFFIQWRGVLQSAARFCSFVTVVQQKTFEQMFEHMQTRRDDPCWHVLELGETLLLKPLPPPDARRLIEWPMRNFLDYEPEVVEQVLRLTGGSPFLIQSLCNKLVAHVARADESSVRLPDVESVAEEFMQPAESIFAHLLDLSHGLGNVLCAEIAVRSEEKVEGVTWDEVRAALPDAPPDSLRGALDQLCAADVLTCTEPGHGEATWRFNSLLYQRWLARNS